MATGKRFYWIKLKDNFYSSEAIEFLMSNKNGANYVVIYNMLCIKTVNTSGKLMGIVGEAIIPYDIDRIQRDLKWFDRDTIVVALELYKRLGLVYEDNDGILTLTDYSNIVGFETDYCKQKELQRERKKEQLQLLCGKEKSYEPETENNYKNGNSEKYDIKRGQIVDTSVDICVDNDVDTNVDNDVDMSTQENKRLRDKRLRDKEIKRIEIRDKEDMIYVENGASLFEESGDSSPDVSSDFSEKKKKATRRSEEIDAVVSRWNDMAAENGIPRIIKLRERTPRYNDLDSRIREYGLDMVMDAIDRVPHSAFLCGKNERGWKISFDWFLDKKKFPRVAEGVYDDNIGNKYENSGRKKSSAEIMIEMMKDGVFDDDT